MIFVLTLPVLALFRIWRFLGAVYLRIQSICRIYLPVLDNSTKVNITIDVIDRMDYCSSQLDLALLIRNLTKDPTL